MKRFPAGSRNSDNVLLLLFALLLFASPLVSWWTESNSPWYMPYLIWGAVIALAAMLQLRRGSGDL